VIRLRQGGTNFPSTGKNVPTSPCFQPLRNDISSASSWVESKIAFGQFGTRFAGMPVCRDRMKDREMSISGVGAYSQWPSRTSVSSTSGGASSDFASAVNSAGASDQNSRGGVQKTDFTNITRSDLADWVNSKIKSGEMSLDDSSAFVGLTMKIPVNGAYAGLDDQENVNLVQKAQDGMTWAQQHNDTDMLKRLQAALGTMQQYQGQVSGVDLTV
jgi:hypothetical protein